MIDLSCMLQWLVSDSSQPVSSQLSNRFEIRPYIHVVHRVIRFAFPTRFVVALGPIGSCAGGSP